MQDRFTDTLRRVGSDPEALRAKTTVSDAPLFLPDTRETFVLETVKTGGGSVIFLEVIDAAGQAHRLVLPPKAVAAIYRHQKTLANRSRRRGARKAYDTQVAQGQDPAERLARRREIGEE